MYSQGDKAKLILEGIKEKISQSTRNLTNFYDAATTRGLITDLTPERRVIPQLEVIDFYGNYALPNQDYVPSSARNMTNLLMQRETGTITSVDLKDILSTFNDGQLTFVGPAGSGKTTLLKMIARGVMEGQFSNLGEVEIVLFIECRDIDFKEEITAAKLVFNSVESKLGEVEVRSLVQLMKSNPTKILLVIDSLDTLQYTLDDVQELIEEEDKANPRVILWNLLTGNIFPGCRIITSSREYAITNYKDKLRAKKVIALAGLTRESMEQIVTGYLGEQGCKETMAYLENKSPALMNLSKTPIFLIYNLIGLQYNIQFKPSTMSGIMIVLLQSIIRSEHARQLNILQVINKLKKLSFIGTNSGRVLFTSDDLRDCELQIGEITDLTVLVPTGDKKSLVEAHEDVFFFSHQSLQEILSAFHIIQMELGGFKSFIDSNIQTSEYAVIRRFVYGLLFDKEVQEAAEEIFYVDDLPQKQHHVKEITRQHLRMGGDSLELMLSLSEGGEALTDVINSALRSIVIQDCPLLSSDMHVIGTVSRKCDELPYLGLLNCRIDSQMMEILQKCYHGSNNKIIDLVLNGNTKLGVGGLSSVGEMVKHCDVDSLYLVDCKIEADQLRAFRLSLGDTKIRSVNIMDLIYDKPVTHDLTEAIAELLPNITEQLTIGLDEVSQDDQVYLQKKLNVLYPTKLMIGNIKKLSCQKTPKEPVAQVFPIDVGDVELTIEDCKILFQQGTFSQSLGVNVYADIDSSEWPDGYIGITPTLHVEADLPLQKPATVRLPTWCVSAYGDGVTVHEVHWMDGFWDTIGSFPHKKEPYIEFKCQNFSPVVGAVKTNSKSRVDYLVHGYLFTSHVNNELLAGFCLCNESLERATKNEIMEMGGKLRRSVRNMRCRIDDKIAVNFLPDDPNIIMKPTNGHTVAILENFDRRMKASLITRRQSSGSIRIDFTCPITNMRTDEKEDSYITHMWITEEEFSSSTSIKPEPGPSSEATPKDATPKQIFNIGTVNAGKFTGALGRNLEDNRMLMDIPRDRTNNTVLEALPPPPSSEDSTPQEAKVIQDIC